MTQTTNYNLNLAEGTDKYNHLTIDNPNYQAIDDQMKKNEEGVVGTATHLKSGTIHAITRELVDTAMFRFVATQNFTTGDEFTVDDISVTALLPDGKTLATNCFVAGATVLCCLVGQRLTVYVSSAEVVAQDSEKLGGQLPAYYATKTEVDVAKNTADAVNVVATQNSERIGAIETKLSGVEIIRGEQISSTCGNATNIATVTLEPGLYVISSRITFASNSTGYRGIQIGTVASASSTAPSMKVGATGGSQSVTYTTVISVETTTQYYLQGYQSSGSALNVSGVYFNALKVA